MTQAKGAVTSHVLQRKPACSRTFCRQPFSPLPASNSTVQHLMPELPRTSKGMGQDPGQALQAQSCTRSSMQGQAHCRIIMATPRREGYTWSSSRRALQGNTEAQTLPWEAWYRRLGPEEGTPLGAAAVTQNHAGTQPLKLWGYLVSAGSEADEANPVSSSLVQEEQEAIQQQQGQDLCNVHLHAPYLGGRWAGRWPGPGGRGTRTAAAPPPCRARPATSAAAGPSRPG